jgi:putative NIF3 family GTP cyclohydrolase 1 type 2
MATHKKPRADHGTKAPLSRREFGALTVSAMAAPFALTSQVTASPAISATDLIDRIKKNIGVEWKPDTFDTIKAGDPATVVSGVVTTAIASMSVLRRAVDAGANLIITSEPTFYGRNDARTPPAGRGGGRGAPPPPDTPPPSDPVYIAKNAFIEKNGLVVFRLNQHWRLRRPDPFATGLASALGWSTRIEAPGDVLRYSIGAVSLSALAAELKKKLGTRGGIRVIGDPQTRVQTVALLPGSTPLAAALDALPAVDVIVAGEVREWESVEYARDVVASGERKGFVTIGRIVSEEGGMSECARWLTTLVSEVPVRHIPAGDPYWSPS